MNMFAIVGNIRRKLGQLVIRNQAKVAGGNVERGLAQAVVDLVPYAFLIAIDADAITSVLLKNRSACRCVPRSWLKSRDAVGNRDLTELPLAGKLKTGF